MVIWWTVTHFFQSNDQIDPMYFETREVLLQDFILSACLQPGQRMPNIELKVNDPRD